MNNDVVVSVKNVSKKFCMNLKRSMAYGILDLSKNLFGIKSDSTQLKKDEFWALDEINFELKKGEALGIIGINGSGKSTLLRLITGIFPPDKGEIICHGRVGSLIAVGAGFHPHMTGKENIFLNGTILGMSSKEILSKFDSIVTFAEIGDFLEAPISAYSSGMKVRLGFSIAVHCEPEILLIDEVLAVGDLRFNKKCADKMQETKKKTSIIFVSHSMRNIYRICDKVMLLENGRIKKFGQTEEVVNEYINMNIVIPQVQDLKILEKIDIIKKIDVVFLHESGEESNEFFHTEKIQIQISLDLKEQINDTLCSIAIFSSEDLLITTMNAESFPFNLKSGENRIECNINNIKLVSGAYYYKIKLSQRFGGLLAEVNTKFIKIKEMHGTLMPIAGFYRESCNWSIT